MKNYIKKGNKIYIDEFKVHDADAASFVDLGMGWGKDKNHGYYGVHQLYESDINSLQPISEYYAKDKSKVFFCNYSFLENSGNVSLINGSFLNEHIHNMDTFFKKEPKNKVEANTLLHYSWLIKDDKKVYYKGKKIPYADPNTFKIICGFSNSRFFYAKDKSRVFFYDEMLGKFKIVSKEPEKFIIYNLRYSSDSKSVYYFFSNHTVIAEANIEHFEALGGDYAKDNRFVFYSGKILSEAQPENFEIITDNSFKYYGKDKNNVFYDSIIVKNVDPETFIYADGVFKDKNHIIIDGKIINTEPNAFVDLGYGYTKDKENVFFRGKQIPEADSNTFFVVNTCGVDKKNVYYEGIINESLKSNEKFLEAIQLIKPDFAFL